MYLLMVPEIGIEPIRPLFTKAADFKSAVSTNFTTQASAVNALLWQKIKAQPGARLKECVCRPQGAAKPWHLGNKFEPI